MTGVIAQQRRAELPKGLDATSPGSAASNPDLRELDALRDSRNVSSSHATTPLFHSPRDKHSSTAPTSLTASTPFASASQGNGSKQDGHAFLSDDARTPIASPPQQRNPSTSSCLRLQTDLAPRFTLTSAALDQKPFVAGAHLRHSGSAGALRPRSSSSRPNLSPAGTPIGSQSPSSTWSSPALSAVADVTPLPSPLAPSSSPNLWNRMSARLDAGEPAELSLATRGDGDPTLSPMLAPQKRKAYNGLAPAVGETRHLNSTSHGRNRSISEFVPGPMRVPRARLSTVSGSIGSADTSCVGVATCMKREEYLAERRGLAAPPGGLLTPPRSDQGTESSDGDSSPGLRALGIALPKIPSQEVFRATRLRDQTVWRWRAVRILGQGTFSKVILAVSEGPDHEEQSADDEWAHCDFNPGSDATMESKKLVAVKVVEHGPAGGASEGRVESSLKRELDILKSLQHPSIVQLRAYSVEPTRALLVLSYCPGGDLFDLASQKVDSLSPGMIRRIFAELVAATRHLHAQHIVHRDIKLENVLLNISRDLASEIADWEHYPYAVVRLTDLGLSRRIDPADPKLHTRCGSEDYASPELLMGQAYDGRETDAWALGVLLYALMEGRLPFDPPPGASEQQRLRSRTVHRIARCEWGWHKFVDQDGQPGGFGELSGARTVVEGLLKRATRRITLERVAEEEWVRGGVQVEGGLRSSDEIDE